MSGYYPPGVTGNEPEIIGYDEKEITFESVCRNCTTELVITNMVVFLVSGDWVCDYYCYYCGSPNEYEEDATEEPPGL